MQVEGALRFDEFSDAWRLAAKQLQSLDAVRERLGPDRLRGGCRLVSYGERGDRVEARFEHRDSTETITAGGDVLVGADGIHSTLRAAFYPAEGAPVWNGTMLWRGAADWPVHVDGRTMVIAGGMAAKFVFYPIHFDPAAPERRLTNWAVMARIAAPASAPPPRREDWNRPGEWNEVELFMRDRFRLIACSQAAVDKCADPRLRHVL